MPGTELVGNRAEFAADSVEEGSHGVLSLLCKGDGNCSLDVALGKNCKEVEKQQNYVANSLLQELQLEKNKFNELESSQFFSARAATNAFEKLGKHRFLNRSAMKLATLDHIFQWTRSFNQKETFSFADICGGPGGFSEYLLWRTEQTSAVHGYGITLKDAANNCDWRLPSKFREMFTICYGEDGTGDLYSLANIRNFRDIVRGQHPNGVDLAVADGGFLDARSQSNQTSRPASSERYIVARGLRAGHPTSKLVEVLEDRLVRSHNSTAKNFQLHFLREQTPLREDVNFIHYMTTVNAALARNQIQACRRINEYVANKHKRKSWDDDAAVDPQEYCQCWQLGRIPRHGC
ncbi:FtsJ methyltransferase domain-containing protein, putative [Phytophthora infestans T30-4]|uniref:Cap-specific mRNA (nucleoside-2'-O-)-methyltransferase 1 n=1 Tax=Phytophthora infestans (strain T30-4) TaxID=403677 RepID=D0N6U0_PHYIT|nr:FtsJ methyltransferase domain-containing protein, putative [Phytophthora infestans T30-4]EEY53289.1 FtsJ methyltransferase domain-containing protein, putative [Phytophthora infestans T30-4]|eukprot:XP_002904907.1 FtsJ methyltransferase domain-containing protein, putative [Phytophthora infestans T30-4]